MKTIIKLLKMPGRFGFIACCWLSLLACSSVKENGEPNVRQVPEITNDVQREAIYENGGTASPQNANPIPPSEKLGLQEKASEINRFKNIEDEGNVNAPSTTPFGERPREVRIIGTDTTPVRLPTQEAIEKSNLYK